MKRYAELFNGLVTIVNGLCEDDHILESTSPIEFVVITELTGEPMVGGSFDGMKFINPPPLPPSLAKSKINDIVNDFLNQQAAQRGYDSMISLCSYVFSLNPVWSNEGRSGVNCRDTAWRDTQPFLDKADRGEQVDPKDVVAVLQPIIWPD